MDENEPHVANILERIPKEIISESTTVINVGQEIITITKDKIEICLMKHLEKLKKRDAWLAPMGIALTMLVTLLSANFKDFIVSKATWQAIFIIGFFLSVVWLVKTLRFAWTSTTIEDILTEIKAESKEVKKKSGLIKQEKVSKT